jgi:hypothetical protein
MQSSGVVRGTPCVKGAERPGEKNSDSSDPRDRCNTRGLSLWRYARQGRSACALANQALGVAVFDIKPVTVPSLLDLQRTGAQQSNERENSSQWQFTCADGQLHERGSVISDRAL